LPVRKIQNVAAPPRAAKINAVIRASAAALPPLIKNIERRAVIKAQIRLVRNEWRKGARFLLEC
jgi:hypothetical protein